ncbi:prohead core protein [uncultured Caudovirales phage]|uniref:Prohead core protein n=1 Tax=uncultured Caudovirales phage TaxID=2100421 RepID=A0A6J5P0J0_9CAUD|nr:prohead core protein [uncultured Caudovirales phage]
MANRDPNTENDMVETYKDALEEAKKAKKHYEKDEEESEEDEEEEESSKSKSKKKKMEEETDLDEETLAASSLKPGSKSIADPKSKIGAMKAIMGMMSGMGKSDAIEFFNKVQAQFGPGKDYGVGDNSAKNAASIDMKSGSGPKTKDAMPKLNVKEDVEEMFNGQDLSEEFKENAATLFEAAVNARLTIELASLEESYEEKIAQELEVMNENINEKLDSYLDYVVENWMKENAVAIESSLRNELMEDFINGLKGLFEEHYISVPENKVDVLEAMATKVEALEQKLDESIQENSELRNELVESAAKDIFVELASDLALTQQEKFIALAEGIEFDGDLDIYEKKLRIIKENYFKTETNSYNSNIEEETFEGDEVKTAKVDPTVGRYLQAISRTVKK